MISSCNRRRLAALGMALCLASCGGGASDRAAGGGPGGGRGGGRGGPGQGTPEVGFVVVQPTSAPQIAQLSGRTAASESSDVRPQVSGIIRRRLFTEGAQVRAGQPLYEIDPSLYRAAANQAQANLAAAQATAEASRVQERRYAPLARMEAVSKQEYTNAVAAARQGSAQVAQQRAALETARINLKFTTVPAPISGRIGRSLFTVGALVQASQPDPLAQIQRLDPMFVDIQQSSADMLALRRQLGGAGPAGSRAQVRLQLEDGSDYGYTGTVQFAEALVNEQTGTVTLRARFPNPQGLLLPGMFVRASFVQAIDDSVFLVPQPALSRDPRGNATVFLVGPGNKAVQRSVTAERTLGADWVVTAGLNAGDRVIVQGTGKLAPNQSIRPMPATSPERLEPGRPGEGGPGGGRRGPRG